MVKIKKLVQKFKNPFFGITSLNKWLSKYLSKSNPKLPLKVNLIPREKILRIPHGNCRTTTGYLTAW
jgi:hypothetical protein